MTDTLTPRGPDDRGIWIDEARGIALGHRRLSIIDLSPLGHQPMTSASGRSVLVYNGEVYNFQELREELTQKGISFRGRSDSEVILEACEHWGVAETAQKLIGMFSFGLWDRSNQTISLVRDRIGIKPLYWGDWNGNFLFGSELKAMGRFPGFQPEIDRVALAGYLRHNYVPGPRSIYQGIHKLTPGSILTFDAQRNTKIDPYWDMRDTVRTGLQNPLNISDEEATNELEKLLKDAVSRRMVADVELGAFLSGGIDSSTVAALMQAQSSRPVKTFSIGFHEAGFNEAQHAKAVASHLGTDHTELYVDQDHARDVIPMLPEIYDEPFADSSQIPTYLVSELTRRHVTVSLSGDGGDELFAGYNRYAYADGIWKGANTLPSWAKETAARVIALIPPSPVNRIAAAVPGNFVPSQFGDKLHKFAATLLVQKEHLYRSLISQWQEPEQLIGAKMEDGPVYDPETWTIAPSYIEAMQYLDTVTYLPDDILTKVDRASMAVSLEARVPLIDHRVVEFAWRLPMSFKIRNGETKWLLRQVLYRYVPRQLIDRPKMGFGVPIDEWMRGPLKDWAADLLDDRRLEDEGFNPSPIKEKWAEHLSGGRNWQYLLWTVLMYQAWRAHESNRP